MLSFLFSLKGRISRKDIWIKYLAPYALISIIASLIDAVMAGAKAVEQAAPDNAISTIPSVGLFGLLVSLFYLWPSIAVPVKRFHDRNMSGWWVLWILLVVVVGIIVMLASAIGGIMFGIIGSTAIGAALVAHFVLLYCLPGTDGENRFGSDPRNPGAKSSVGAGSKKPATNASPIADWAKRAEEAIAGFKSEEAPVAPSSTPRTNWQTASTAPVSSFGRRQTIPSGKS